jgi:hypothetical protein
MEILTISQILFWVAVGGAITIAVLLLINWYRNIYGKTPEFIDAEDNPLNRQTQMLRREMKKQDVKQETRADDVKTALDAQETKVQNALEGQEMKIQEEFEKQKTETKEHLTAQREIVEDALKQHQTATQPDLSTETEIIKEAIEKALQTKNERTG